MIASNVVLTAGHCANFATRIFIGSDVTKQLKAGLSDETNAIREYNEAAAICREAGDAGSKYLFERLLHDEERHADFLESQLHSINEMGIGPYLSQQMEK